MDLLKRIFIGLLSTCKTAILGESLASNSDRCIKCVSLNKRPFQAKPILVDISSNKPVFYRFTVSINK